MKDDVRYSEFLFLRTLERRDQKFEYIFINSQEQQGILGLHQLFYMQMVVALAEDGYAVFDQQNLQLLIGRLRGEVAPDFPQPSEIHDFEWGNPRNCIQNKLLGAHTARLLLTYRGLCRIEELRELLKRDRILEDFGILLSLRYVRRDLQEALQRSHHDDVAVSVLYLDMDDFGKINKQSGQAAGDVVMKAYLEAVQQSIGNLGEAYRGVGDEVVGIIIGQGHSKAMEIAEAIRQRVAGLRCVHKETQLPNVSVSIGVATTPPESRSMDVETLAEDRKRKAKAAGKNRVVDF